MSQDTTDGAEGAPERDWLGSLFAAHSARLYRLARRLSPGADEALDLVQ
jgi:DNA-directed RNA polymerase specialized sigma24 family protein